LHNYPDISRNPREGPSYRTTSLVDNLNNRLYEAVVTPLGQWLETLMNDYNARAGARLSMQALDQKFLQADPLEDVKRFFVANFHEIYHLAPLNSTRLIRNAGVVIWAVAAWVFSCVREHSRGLSLALFSVLRPSHLITDIVVRLERSDGLVLEDRRSSNWLWI
jgi:hypothetical protein